MNNYMAVIRKANSDKSFKLHFEATDSSTALDKMYEASNAKKSDDIIEYELYQEIDFNKYISVSFKPTSITVLPVKQETVAVVYSEQSYIPYTKQVA